MVKPSVLGGVENTVELSEWAHSRGIRVVLSSSFESSVGIAGLTHLAAVVDSKEIAMYSGKSSAASSRDGTTILEYSTSKESSEPGSIKEGVLYTDEQSTEIHEVESP